MQKKKQLRPLPTPGLPVDLAESDLLQTAVRLTRDLSERLPEIEAQNETLRDLLDKLERDWSARPTSVLGADDPRLLQVSTHVATEVDSLADQDVAAALRSAKRAVVLSETPMLGPDANDLLVPVINLCLNDGGDSSVPTAESNNYLLWTLLLADQATVNKARADPSQLTATLPLGPALHANSATEFRSMLGSSGKPTKNEDAQAFLYWDSPQATADKVAPVLAYDSTGGKSIERLQLAQHPALYRDPVKLLAVVDLFIRNRAKLSPGLRLDTFASDLAKHLGEKEGQALYQAYACILNTLGNENWITAALAKRLRPRPVVRQRTASDWSRRATETARLQQSMLVGTRCVGYLPSAVNVIATRDKLIVPEPKFQTGSFERVLLFMRCSSLDPYVDSTLLVVLETEKGTQTLHVLGHLPTWLGTAHTDALATWLQVHAQAELWGFSEPVEFLDVVERLTGGSVPVEDAVAAARGRKIVKRWSGQSESESVGLDVRGELAWAAFPLMGRGAAKLESGETAAEHVEPVFQKSGALAKFKRDVASIFELAPRSSASP